MIPTDNVEMDLVFTLFGKNGAQAVILGLFLTSFIHTTQAEHMFSFAPPSIHSFYTAEHVLCSCFSIDNVEMDLICTLRKNGAQTVTHIPPFLCLYCIPHTLVLHS